MLERAGGQVAGLAGAVDGDDVDVLRAVEDDEEEAEDGEDDEIEPPPALESWGFDDDLRDPAIIGSTDIVMGDVDR